MKLYVFMNFIGNGEQATYSLYLFSVRLTRVEEKLNKGILLARLASFKEEP